MDINQYHVKYVFKTGTLTKIVEADLEGIQQHIKSASINGVNLTSKSTVRFYPPNQLVSIEATVVDKT